MKNIGTWATGLAASAALMAAIGVGSAQAAPTTTLYSFCSQADCADGRGPTGALTQGTDGNFYGTTDGAGANAAGTIFKISPSGTFTLVYTFCSVINCADDPVPYAKLLLASDGNFYGTTPATQNGHATVFKLTPGGTVTTIYTFSTTQADVGLPQGGLVQGEDGNLYGTTYAEGANNKGSVFKITTSGSLTTLYSFCSEAKCADGSFPAAGLVQASNGAFYGTTTEGGTKNAGTVFRITRAGVLKVLHSFDGTTGYTPQAPLIQSATGELYGTAWSAGPSSCSPECGTVFAISPAGVFKTIYTFCSETNCTDGFDPYGVIQGTDGNLYGTTKWGGTYTYGTAFKLTRAGKLTTLHSFKELDGKNPYAQMLQGTGGEFYGLTTLGGADKEGVVFSVSTNLAPFVSLQATLGSVGSSVIILGTDLTGASAVTFNGTAAVFTVVSATEITATVPAGATSGTVEVITPGGTLLSNSPFTVK